MPTTNTVTTLRSKPAHNTIANGMRLVLRRGEAKWTHGLEMQVDDLDCTDMSDAEFEAAVLEVCQ